MYLARIYLVKMCLQRTFSQIFRAASTRRWASALSAAGASSRGYSASRLAVVRSSAAAVSRVASAAVCSSYLFARHRSISAFLSAIPSSFAFSSPTVVTSRGASAATCPSSLWARCPSVSASSLSAVAWQDPRQRGLRWSFPGSMKVRKQQEVGRGERVSCVRGWPHLQRPPALGNASIYCYEIGAVDRLDTEKRSARSRRLVPSTAPPFTSPR